MAKLSGLTVVRSSSVPLPTSAGVVFPILRISLIRTRSWGDLPWLPFAIDPINSTRPGSLPASLLGPTYSALISHYTVLQLYSATLPHRLSSFPSPSIPLLISFLGRGSSLFMTPDFFHPPWYRCGLCLWNTTLFIYLFWGVFPFFVLNSRTQAQLWGQENLFIHACIHSCICHTWISTLCQAMRI